MLLCCSRNEANLLYQPTKTPEYLAGGKPVKPIRDKQLSIWRAGLVWIAENLTGLCWLNRLCIAGKKTDWLRGWTTSWHKASDDTWAQMSRSIEACMDRGLLDWYTADVRYEHRRTHDR
jgi:hypothetical protein